MNFQEPQRQMSLIPYASDRRDIVLRHGDAVVVFDPQSNELALRDASHDDEDYSACPYCHRPLTNDRTDYSDDQSAHSPDIRHGFVDPDYFRMLAHSTPGSASPSRPPSPSRRLPYLQPAGSRSTNASGPPSGAEFVGSTPQPQTVDQGIQGSSFLPGYFERFFVEKRLLGRGGRGVVLLVEHVLDGVYLGEFACKRIPVGNDHDWLAKVLIEVQLLQRLNHPSLVSYRHVWLEDARINKLGPSVPCIFILQQYCNAGDLQGYVRDMNQASHDMTDVEAKKRMFRRQSSGQPEPVGLGLNTSRRMSLDEIFSIFRDITSGLHHLHVNNYIHRDLKPSNILLHRDGSRLTVHVSDFGEVQAASATRDSTGATGTISYCAPEVLLRESPDGAFGNFTTKSDIFSLGMILYFMCFGKLPYIHAMEDEEYEDLDQLRAEITAWPGFAGDIKIRNDLPERVYKFLKQLLSLNPDERPSTEEILQGLKTGAGVDDLRPPITPTSKRPGMHPRFSAVDSPAPESSTRRDLQGSDLSRPTFSPLIRNPSSDGGIRQRTSPQRTSNSDAPTSRDSGIVLSTRKVHSPRTTPSPAQPQSPRLMLPPPPTAAPPSYLTILRQDLDLFLHRPSILMSLKITIFLLKVLSLTLPCAPYAATSFVLYPLLCLAALDVGVGGRPFGSLSFILGTVHVLLWIATRQTGRLCSGPVKGWEDF